MTLLVGSFDPYKPIPDITYNVFGGMLNLALSVYLSCLICAAAAAADDDDDDDDAVLWCGVFRGDADDSRQATVDWSWGTVRYRLGSTDDDDGDDEDERSESVSSPQPPDVQPPSHTTELQVGHRKLSQTLSESSSCSVDGRCSRMESSL